MRPLQLLFLAVTLVGCQSGRHQTRWTPPAFEPPRTGQIQVALSGAVKTPGTHWVAASATLASIELIAGDGVSDSPPRKVMITRMENGHANNTVLVLAKMSQREKERVVLRHGDVVQFYTEQPAVFPH